MLIIRNSTSSDHSARKYNSASARYRECEISEESSGLATRSTKFHANFHDRSRACSILFRSIHIVATVHGDRSSVSPAICVPKLHRFRLSVVIFLVYRKHCPVTSVAYRVTSGQTDLFRRCEIVSEYARSIRAHPRACIHT